MNPTTKIKGNQVMPLELSLKKKYLVKRLDFENCVFGGFKTIGTGGRSRSKRLTARLGKGIGIVDKTPERKRKKASRDGESLSGSGSPVLTLGKGRRGSFPVLSKRYLGGSGSPVFRCRRDASPKVTYRSKRKIDFGEDTARGLANGVTGSPVFKLKPSELQSKKKRISKRGTPSGNLTQRLVKACLRCDDHPGQGETIRNSSSQIEEFTQSGELTNAEIFTQDSEEEEQSISSCSGSSTKDTSSELIQGSTCVSVTEDSEYDDSPQERLCERTGFANRVRRILEKHRSRKKTEQVSAEKVKVMDKWSIGRNRFFLKCSRRDSEGKTDLRYIITDDGAAIWGAAVGSTLRIHPPWRAVAFGKPEVVVWTDVFRIESDPEEMVSPDAREVFAAEIPEEESSHLLVGSLLASSVSPFLI